MDVPPNKTISEFVADLAKEHGVTYQNSAMDQLAKKLSELSDKEVDPDDTCDLIVALSRAKVITAREMSNLVVRHLREVNVLKGARV